MAPYSSTTCGCATRQIVGGLVSIYLNSAKSSDSWSITKDYIASWDGSTSLGWTGSICDCHGSGHSGAGYLMKQSSTEIRFYSNCGGWIATMCSSDTSTILKGAFLLLPKK